MEALSGPLSVRDLPAFVTRAAAEQTIKITSEEQDRGRSISCAAGLIPEPSSAHLSSGCPIACRSPLPLQPHASSDNRQPTTAAISQGSAVIPTLRVPAPPILRIPARTHSPLVRSSVPPILRSSNPPFLQSSVPPILHIPRLSVFPASPL